MAGLVGRAEPPKRGDPAAACLTEIRRGRSADPAGAHCTTRPPRPARPGGGRGRSRVRESPRTVYPPFRGRRGAGRGRKSSVSNPSGRAADHDGHGWSSNRSARVGFRARGAARPRRIGLGLRRPPSRPAPSQAVRAPDDPDAGYASEFYGRSGVALGARVHGAHLGGDFDGETTTQRSGHDLPLRRRRRMRATELVLGILHDAAAFRVRLHAHRARGRVRGVSPATSSIAPSRCARSSTGARTSPVQPLALLRTSCTRSPTSRTARATASRSAPASCAPASAWRSAPASGWWLSRRLLLDLRAYYVYQEFARAEGVA
jgi:hypothetical protein